MADIIEIMKKAALEAINNSSPSSVLFGVVINTRPLEIQVEQKLVLTKEFLILTKNVIDYDVNVSLDCSTDDKILNANHSHEISGNISVSEGSITNTLAIEKANIDLTHNHSITGKKKITIHNALKQNDKVILLQQQGGQKFIVLDKIY